MFSCSNGKPAWQQVRKSPTVRAKHHGLALTSPSISKSSLPSSVDASHWTASSTASLRQLILDKVPEPFCT